MGCRTTELMVPSVVAAEFLILTALGKAVVTMIASAVMLLSLLLVDRQTRSACLRPMIVGAPRAAAIAVTAVLLIP